MKIARSISMLASSALVAAGLTLVPLAAAPATAAAEPFDPGHLISDSLMYDGDSMSISQIQAFLDKKGSDCVAASVPCLKDYKATIHSKPLDPAKPDRCIRDITGSSTQRSAATIIFVVARDCGVSAKVLLVTLQKEQGLVASPAPTKRSYQAATGYDCPDNGTCNPEVAGFFNQVYWAARAYRAYRIASAYPAYQPGIRDILYHPEPSTCGSKSVNIRNVATTALYTYTPYTPNAAALANPYLPGDSCSSYGNRNFWLYYNAWFGNTGAGDNVLAYGSSTSLVAANERRVLPASTSRLRAILASADVPAHVSASYLQSIPSAGTLGLVVKSESGNVYALAGSGKFQLASCAVATSIGFDCDSAPTLPSEFLAKLGTSTSVAAKSRVRVAPSSGQHFVLEDGERREFVASGDVSGAALGPALAIDTASLGSVPYGSPYMPGDDLVAIAGTGDFAAKLGSGSFRVPAGYVAESAITTWFGKAQGSLSSLSVAELEGVRDLPQFFSDGTSSFAFGVNGKVPLSTPSEWSADFPELDPAVVSKIPTSSAIAGAAFVKSPASSVVYLVSDRQRRKVSTIAHREALAAQWGISPTVRILPSATLADIPAGPSVFPSGSVVRAGSLYFVIDGATSRIATSELAAREFAGPRAILTVANSSLSAYSLASGQLLPSIQCASGKYLAVAGNLRTISEEDAAEYGSSLNFRSVSAATCAALPKVGATGVFLRYVDTYYQVNDGSRSALSVATYKSRSAGKVPATTVSKYVLQLVPLG